MNRTASRSSPPTGRIRNVGHAWRRRRSVHLVQQQRRLLARLWRRGLRRGGQPLRRRHGQYPRAEVFPRSDVPPQPGAARGRVTASSSLRAELRWVRMGPSTSVMRAAPISSALTPRGSSWARSGKLERRRGNSAPGWDRRRTEMAKSGSPITATNGSSASARMANSATPGGSRGSGEGEFQNPNGVAVNAGGQVFVADADNNRLQVFTADGQFLATIGSYGAKPGQFRTRSASRPGTTGSSMSAIAIASRPSVSSPRGDRRGSSAP